MDYVWCTICFYQRVANNYFEVESILSIFNVGRIYNTYSYVCDNVGDLARSTFNIHLPNENNGKVNR